VASEAWGIPTAVKSYQDLIVWQKAMDLVELVYRISARFPKEELYGLTSQVRRASISIASNIAEGQGRRTTREFLHFLSIARGSICEVPTQFLIAQRLGYVEESRAAELMEKSAEVCGLLNGLANSLAER
jgi:four helix bundle protein